MNHPTPLSYRKSVRFDRALVPGRLVHRFKRFLADVELGDGTITTVHCPNSGSMRGCLGEGWPVMLSRSDNPKRKLPLTWEMVHNGRCWIGVNTHLANRLAAEAIERGIISELRGYHALRREVAYGEASRVDILLQDDVARCYVEVKNVTMVDDAGRYAFPDAVTARGRKHLGELANMVDLGHRAAMLFLVQRADGEGFAPAADIDPAYADALHRAADRGVELLAYRAQVTPEEIRVVERVPVHLDE